MPAWDAKEVARADTLLASFIFIEIGTFDAYDPYIGGVGVPPSIPSRDEFSVRASRARVWISPKRRGGNTCSTGIRHFIEGRVIRIREGNLVPLRLKAPDGPCRDEPQSDCNHPHWSTHTRPLSVLLIVVRRTHCTPRGSETSSSHLIGQSPRR